MDNHAQHVRVLSLDDGRGGGARLEAAHAAAALGWGGAGQGLLVLGRRERQDGQDLLWKKRRLPSAAELWRQCFEGRDKGGASQGSQDEGEHGHGALKKRVRNSVCLRASETGKRGVEEAKGGDRGKAGV